MEVGGEVKRGKVKLDTIITFLCSLALVGIGITFVLAPISAEPYSIGERLIRVLGILAIINGSICAADYRQRIKCELHPLS